MDAERSKMNSAPPLSAAAVSALHQGNKIEAIKIVREEQNIGLKEAKDAVDEYVRGHQAVQAPVAAAQAQTKKSALLWFAIFLGLAFLAYHLFSSRAAWGFVLTLAAGGSFPALCH